MNRISIKLNRIRWAEINPLIVAFFVLSLFLSANSYAQNFEIQPGLFNVVGKDTTSFYFKDVWISSKDINQKDALGFTRRAFDKIKLGYYKEALADVDKSIRLDSSIGRNYYLKGYVQFRQNYLYSALDNFKKAISLKDTDTYTYFYTAQISMALGRTDEADSLLRNAIDKDKNFVDAYFALGNLHNSVSNYSKAEEYYKKVIELDPKFAPAYYNIAVMHVENEPSTALKYLDKCIAAKPDFSQAYFMMGNIYLSQQRFAMAIKHLDKAIEIEPSNRLYKAIKAIFYIYNSQFITGYNDVISAFDITTTTKYARDFMNASRNRLFNDFLSEVLILEENSEKLPPTALTSIKVALCHFLRRNYYYSNELLKDVLNHTTLKGLVNYYIGINYEYMRMPDFALMSFYEAVKDKSVPFEIYWRRGMSLAEVKRPQEAITNLNTYLNMISYNKAAYLSRGIIYMNTWKSDSAILDFNMCLKLDSTDADIYYNRAICYKKWEKYDKAEKDFTKVLEFRAGDIDVTCLLAESKYMLGDTTFAYDLLNQTAEKFKFLTLNGYFIRGTINLGYKKYGLAISDLSAVIDKNHAYTEAYVYRGLAYYCIGEFEKSKEDFTEAIKYDKNNITALYTRGLANIKLKTPDEAYSDLIKAESLGHPLAKRARLIYLKDFVPTK